MSEAFERVILGTILVDDKRWGEVSSLKVDDFALSSHRIIFSEIRTMKDRGLSVDYVTLSEHMGPARVKEVGGSVYLSSTLVDGMPRFPDLSQYVEGIKEHARKRRVKLAGAQLLNKLERGQDVDAAVASFNKNLPPAEEKRNAATPFHARLIRLADVAPKHVPWLWEPYLPLGMLSLVSGDSDVGKSFMLEAVAAGMTLGQLPNGAGPCPRINILHFTNENSPEFVLRPRLDSLGGDATRYYYCPGSELTDENGEKHEGGITLGDTAALDDALSASQAKLMLIDPIQSYLPSGTDAHRAPDVRRILDPLAKLAEKHQCCIVLIRHLNKGSGGKALYRGSMSIDFTAACRSELLVGYDQQDHNKRAFVHTVHNVGPEGPAMGFEIDQAGQFSWTGQSTLTAAQILADPTDESPEVAGALREAVGWLRDFLTPDSQPQQECVKQAEQNGISFATLKRAKSALAVKSRKATFKGHSIWSLPEITSAPLSLEPVEPLWSNSHETKDMNGSTHLSRTVDPEETLNHLEDLQNDLSHTDENPQSGSSKNTPLSHTVKYNNNKDLHIYQSVTNAKAAQLSGEPPRARKDEVPNGFDPVA